VAERFLFDSLIFATWSLLTDHHTAERPFEFHESVARDFTIRTLNASVSRTDGSARNDLCDQPELARIVQGFTRLSHHLESLRAREAELLRPQTEYPKFVKQTNLHRFPFLHTVPFLDLTGASQVGLVSGLAEVGRGLNDSGIMTARNGLLHAQRQQRTPTIVEVNSALAGARKALNTLEEVGCVRTTFEVARTETDAWGRGVIVMRSGVKEITFSSPSRYDMLGLPAMEAPVYIVQGAVFAPPNEMLRFREGAESQYEEYWRGFPVRPEPSSGSIAAEPDVSASPLLVS
jgi:hypothetical protein